MVLKRPFHCPTQVTQCDDFEAPIAALLNGRRWALVTSAGWISRGIPKRLSKRCGTPTAIVGYIETNPGISTVVGAAQDLRDADIVLALGGGSVIDATKGAVALRALNHDLGAFSNHLRQGKPLPDTLMPVPVVAVPTTSGTGAEVTCWGTIWGEDGIKHSVNHPTLYPGDAVLDPSLCASMPRDLTIWTALDALSHAMESVWNRRHMPATDALATQAIGMIRECLSETVAAPNDLRLRERMQTAAMMSGLAMGTTQTAVAHSISYPFTAHFGVPHGLACSFTLPEVARYNMETDSGRLTPIADGLGCAVSGIPSALESWFDELGVGAMLNRYVTPNMINGLDDTLITRSRAANNIREVNGAAAHRMVKSAVSRLCSVKELDAAANS